jgi:hypothetical protein
VDLPIELKRSITSRAPWIEKRFVYQQGLPKDSLSLLSHRIDICRIIAPSMASSLSANAERTEIIIRSRFIQRACSNEIDKHEYLKNLFSVIKSLHMHGVLHGDLCRKNIIFSENAYHLIDFEPFLITQTQSGGLRFCTTKPYLCRSNLENVKYSEISDWIGFWSFCFYELGLVPLPQLAANRLQYLAENEAASFDSGYGFQRILSSLIIMILGNQKQVDLDLIKTGQVLRRSKEERGEWQISGSRNPLCRTR